MKFWGPAALALLFFSPVLSALSGQEFGDKRREAVEFSLHEVDFTLLVNQARSRDLGLSDEELERLVGSNFQFIFFNRLNTTNFVTTPPPKNVLEKMVNILQLSRELEKAVGEGRKLVMTANSDKKRKTLVRNVRGSAKRLGKMFGEYFLDIRPSPHQISLRRYDSRDVQFTHYLIQLDRLERLLRQELDHYFFNPAPGVVDLSEYYDLSIGTLSKSIIKLSDMTEKVFR